MNIGLQRWNCDLKHELIKICNKIDRSYLKNRLPNPYTEKSAHEWLDMMCIFTVNKK